MENTIVKTLIDKGVRIPNPESIYISQDVDPDRISNNNVTIYSGCKIIGKQTLISDNCQLGYEAPVTLENTLVGSNTKLNGGFFKGAVFAGNNSFGSGAHVRDGTIFEEGANAAHTVGLKQTILFPFVTLGSLINFCDCFMAGGTSRKDHSEVGSSYIHFNYTPNQDKATPSMMGDVHHGVMLQSAPIFLGGQGGLVGPVRIEYGCMTAAGSIIRKNELKKDRLLLGGGFRDISMPKQAHVYKNISHIFNNNIHYIASLIALKAWYRHVRPLFSKNVLSTHLVHGLQDALNDCIKERISRLNDFCEKLILSKQILLKKMKGASEIIKSHDKVLDRIQLALETFDIEGENNTLTLKNALFVECVDKKASKMDKDYISTIQCLTPKEQETGTQWLDTIRQSILKKLII
ncbi:MAG: protein GlmU [Desulfobacula sp.]|nr:protein GlmU [Desulfobacula sp.]